jgi:hypothetical protein
MAPWLSKLQTNTGDCAHAGERGGVFHMLHDLLAVCRQSLAAADHYEELKSMSDAALAEKGLARQDLARVAFDRLTEED